jgi:hypothetical protein
MKKRPKLLVRRETVRALDRVELVHVAGGFSSDVQCPALVPAGVPATPKR